MADLILHHFASSPFSEKIRLILGFKQLAWKSVDVPMILPKPDVVALTGGYRRTPFLQIGADIYCDTQLMAKVIERRAPSPTLWPAGLGGMPDLLTQWADMSLFWAAVPYTSQPPGAPFIIGNNPPTPDFFRALMTDRAAILPATRPTVRDASAALVSYLGWLEGWLAGQGAGPFVLGEQPCVADFAIAQSIWFIRLAPPMATVLAPFPRVTAWFERVEGFGHGTPDVMSSADAIAIAAAGTRAEVSVDAQLGFEAGAPVTVTATDYASDPVRGTLVGLSNEAATIERRDDRAGVVHVHFPRIGYQLKRAKD